MAKIDLNTCPICGAETECTTAEKGGVISIEVQAKQRQGGAKECHALWLKLGNTGSEYTDRWQCSRCKQTARAETWGRVCEYERCPHCGAIMGEYDDDDGSGVGQTFSPD